LRTAGRERLKAFTIRKQVDGHLAAFAVACRRHTPWRAWFNERVRLPRSLKTRTALTPREIRMATKLLSSQAKLPSSYEVVST
jgi:hypothetical protein